MAITQRSKADEDRGYTLKCKGLTAAEFFGLYHALLKEFGKRDRVPSVSNPVPPFDAKSIHEIFVQLTRGAVAGYAGKKAIDIGGELITKFVEKKLLASSTQQRKKVIIFGPNNKPLYEIEFKEDKRRKGP
jgi:hypothetical protein